MRFTNYKCPVCEKIFTEDDDVVVCAECGTPHHRECYNEFGGCFNEKKHGTNEPIEVEFTEAEENVKADFQNTADVKPNESENPGEIVQEIFEKFNNNAEDIFLNGKHISFYEAAIGKNQKYYIPRFMLADRTKKATSWNIGAFFVPLAWCLYRKMYKFALIIFALYMLVTATVTFSVLGDRELTNAMTVCAEEDPEFATKILLYDMDSYDGTLTKNQMKLYKLMNEFEMPFYIVAINYLVTLGVRMVMGIFATGLYFKKLTSSIEKVQKLSASPDMQRSLLFRRCGTAPIIIAIIVGFMEWQMF